MTGLVRRLGSIALLFLASACATSVPRLDEPVKHDPRLVNLQRAAALPWTDGGRCAVQEASGPWSLLVERCYPALEHDRIEFHDLTGRCAVASVGAAAIGMGACVLAAPELLVGAVVVTGVVVVGLTLKAALSATKPALHEQLQEKKKPKPEPKEPEVPPLWPPTTSERDRPRCEPILVKHRGGDDAHDECADKYPPNRYPGKDVLVAGKHLDALQVGARVLWEIKTDQFDMYSAFLRNQVVEDQVEEMREERDIALSCGYGFVIGVSTEEHKEALELQAPELQIVVTGCKR